MVVQKGVHRGRGGRTSSRSASDILRACDEGEAVGLLWMGVGGGFDGGAGFAWPVEWIAVQRILECWLLRSLRTF